MAESGQLPVHWPHCIRLCNGAGCQCNRYAQVLWKSLSVLLLLKVLKLDFAFSSTSLVFPVTSDIPGCTWTQLRTCPWLLQPPSWKSTTTGKAAHNHHLSPKHLLFLRAELSLSSKDSLPAPGVSEALLSTLYCHPASRGWLTLHHTQLLDYYSTPYIHIHTPHRGDRHLLLMSRKYPSMLMLCYQ